MEYTLNVHSKNILLKLKDQIIPNYLYMVSRQYNNTKLNTYNSFICATTSEENARKLHPSGNLYNFYSYDSKWVKLSDINKLDVKCIGIADPYIKNDTIILSNMNIKIE